MKDRNYKGIADESMYEELIEFLDKVFEREEFPGFCKLLPKLYLKERKPWEHNHVICENGKMIAAVGVYDGSMKIGDDELKYRGIGNVAVDKEYRNCGLMRDAMEMAIRKIKDDGIDFMTLGGQRQRYQYYGFETVGIEYRVSINRTNAKHVYKNRPYRTLQIKEMDKENQNVLDKMFRLHERKEIHSKRSRDIFADIMCSWIEKVYVIFDEDECIGYFTGNMQELTLENMMDFPDVIQTWLQQEEEIELIIPPWNYELMNAVNELYEYCDMCATEMFYIFDYCKVLRVLLKWKSKYEKLADGQLSLQIHGQWHESNIHIKIQNNEGTVEEKEHGTGIELTGQEAMQLIFGMYSSKRNLLKPEIRTWFPLSIYIEHADEV